MARRDDVLILLAGMVIGGALGGLLALHHRADSTPAVTAPVVGPPVVAGPRLGELTRLMQLRQRRAQALLDATIGAGRSQVSVAAVDWDGRGDVVTLKRLSLAVVVEATKIVIDPDTKMISEARRPSEEIEQLAELAMAAAGFDRDRDDLLTVHSLPFDKTQQIQAREAARAGDRVGLWGKVVVALVTIAVIAVALRRGSSAVTRGALALGAATFLGSRGFDLALSPAASLALGAAVFLTVLGVASLARPVVATS
jgi:hypothetical protein